MFFTRLLREHFITVCITLAVAVTAKLLWNSYRKLREWRDINKTLCNEITICADWLLAQHDEVKTQLKALKAEASKKVWEPLDQSFKKIVTSNIERYREEAHSIHSYWLLSVRQHDRLVELARRVGTYRQTYLQICNDQSGYLEARMQTGSKVEALEQSLDELDRHFASLTTEQRRTYIRDKRKLRRLQKQLSLLRIDRRRAYHRLRELELDVGKLKETVVPNELSSPADSTPSEEDSAQQK